MVRIIAGARKGRVLVTPEGSATRPTADRVRQALFDMLAHAPWGGADLLAGAHVLDAFAGTGALGLEALSRGAGHATFFETDRAALAALRANIRACGWENRCTVIARDVTAPPRIKADQTPAGPVPASLVFVDPPYRMTLPARALTGLKASGWLAENATVVIETGRDEPLPFTDTTAHAAPSAATTRPAGQAAPPSAAAEPGVFAPSPHHEATGGPRWLAERQHGAARLSIWRL